MEKNNGQRCFQRKHEDISEWFYGHEKDMNNTVWPSYFSISAQFDICKRIWVDVKDYSQLPSSIHQMRIYLSVEWYPSLLRLFM